MKSVVVSIDGMLKDEFGKYPQEYIRFMAEFIDLKVHNKGTYSYKSYSGKQKERSYHYYIYFNLMYDKGLVICILYKDNCQLLRFFKLIFNRNFIRFVRFASHVSVA